MKNKKYILIITIGFILWFSETAYFGWNKDPCCGLEAMLDTVALVLIFWGIIGDLISDIIIIKR